MRSVLGCWRGLCPFYIYVCIYIYFPHTFSRAGAFERQPGRADVKWQISIKDKYRAAFFQLGGQIPGDFTAAVILSPLRRQKNPLNAAVAILHYILRIWLFEHFEW